jgi:hypothetical protein
MEIPQGNTLENGGKHNNYRPDELAFLIEGFLLESLPLSNHVYCESPRGRAETTRLVLDRSLHSAR